MHRMVISLGCLLAVTVAVWTASGRAADKNVNWPAYAGDKGSTKYSPLDQINKDTIKNLKIAWRRSGMPEELRETFPNVQAPLNYQHTPLMIDGLLYMNTAVGVITALDPATGKTVWYDLPPLRADGQGPQRGASTRSIAYWTDGCDARIITNMGTSLVALNAKTGAAPTGAARRSTRRPASWTCRPCICRTSSHWASHNTLNRRRRT